MKPSTRTFISSILLAGLLFSCNKKFDHKIPAENTTPVSCELCDYANQLSGQYRGDCVSQYYNYYDSLTITMEHIFLNLGPQKDSTVMYFRRIKEFDSKLGIKIDTVFIHSTNGDFNPVAMKIFNDSMIVDEKLYGHSGPVIVLDFNGKKIP